MPSTLEIKTMPPRECLDFRALDALLAVVARNDPQFVIAPALAQASQIALHQDDDPELAAWLQDATLRLCAARRQFDAHMQDHPDLHPTFAGILNSWKGDR